MSPKLWSDEDRLFIPRLGGWTINFKYFARKLGCIKTPPVSNTPPSSDEHSPETPEDRVRRSVEQSRFENR